MSAKAKKKKDTSVSQKPAHMDANSMQSAHFCEFSHKVARKNMV